MKVFLSVLFTVALALSPSACLRRGLVVPAHPPASPGPVPEEDALRNGGVIIAYDGEDGKTALELLKLHARVVTTNAGGLGELVVTINGIGARNNNGFNLIYYVNGSMPKTGAGNYITKNGDKIEWKIIGPRKNE
jgi:hypothetical protein